MSEGELNRLRRHLHFGWPLGSSAFVDDLERTFGCRMRPGVCGRPTRRRVPDELAP